MAKFLNRFRTPIIAGDMSSPDEGEIWYNSSLRQLRFKSPDSNPTSIGAGARFNDWGSNRWYMTSTGAATTANITVNRMYGIPFTVTRSADLNGIAMEMTTAFTTTVGTVRCGLYYSDYTNTPGLPIADYGTVAASVGIKTFTGFTNTLAPGSYFVAIVIQGGATGGTGAFRATSGVVEQIGEPVTTPTSALFNGSLTAYYSATAVSAAFPSPFGTISGAVSGPRVALRFNN